MPDAFCADEGCKGERRFDTETFGTILDTVRDLVTAKQFKDVSNA